jgi:hypothetical protein
MLHDAANIRAFADFPWLLSPAAAMFVVVLGLNLSLAEARSGTAIHGSTEGAGSLYYDRPL